MQKNFDLSVIGLDFNNDLQIILKSYLDEVEGKKIGLMTIDGHGMRPTPKRELKDLIKDINNMKDNYAGLIEKE